PDRRVRSDLRRPRPAQEPPKHHAVPLAASSSHQRLTRLTWALPKTRHLTRQLLLPSLSRDCLCTSFGDLAQQGLDFGDGGVAGAVQPGQVGAEPLQRRGRGVAFAGTELQKRHLSAYLDGARVVRAEDTALVVEQVAQ